MVDEITKIVDRLEEGVDTLVPRDDLLEKLARSRAEGEPLRIKLGIDPSAPHLTLGHSVPLRKMRQFQDLGHTGILVVGDFTRLIGDPSGRSSTRSLMSEEEIRDNMETYQEQAFKILDRERTEIRYNSEWLSALSFVDLLGLTSKYTVARMLERDDFAKRYAEGRAISILELLYPLAQGYDSVAIRADIELGGADQLFNLLVGRDIQREYGQAPQVVMTVPLLIGIDGERAMSQTTGNYVGINEAPGEMFGKLLSIPDHLIDDYFLRLTDIDPEAIADLALRDLSLRDLSLRDLSPRDVSPRDVSLRAVAPRNVLPRDAKRALAQEIVTIYHGKEAAAAAQEEFDRVHIHRERPREVPQVLIDRKLLKEDGTIWVIDLLEAAGMVKSRGEAKRLIAQGGVRIGDERIAAADLDLPFEPPLLIQVGKRSFAEAV